jgi:hypothetical protein
MAGQVCKHYNNRYSLKIGFETNTVLSEYERECVGRKLTGLAAENAEMLEHIEAIEFERASLMGEVESLKENLAALTDVKRIADNLADMERMKLKADNNQLKERNLYLLANLKLADTEQNEMLRDENDRLKSEIAEHEQCFYEQGQALAGQIIETERLKAKLDKIEERCNTPIHVTYDQFGGGMASGYNILKKYILEIIKEGESV